MDDPGHSSRSQEIIDSFSSMEIDVEQFANFNWSASSDSDSNSDLATTSGLS